VSHDPTLEEQAARAVAADYDRIADEYARHIYAELAGKPFDRKLLDRFATLVGGGRVCDVGCGPGHVARYLHERGCDVFGIDLSPRMVQLAAKLNPGVEFRVGDLRSLQLPNGSLAGIVAFYSLIHLRADQLAPALAELRHVLRPGGRLLLAVHQGDEPRRPGELWGIPVALQFNFSLASSSPLRCSKPASPSSRSATAPPIPRSRSPPTASTSPPSPPNLKEQPNDDPPDLAHPDRPDTRRRIPGLRPLQVAADVPRPTRVPWRPLRGTPS
jgi:SAM-dependent methyltransferase